MDGMKQKIWINGQSSWQQVFEITVRNDGIWWVNREIPRAEWKPESVRA